MNYTANQLLCLTLLENNIDKLSTHQKNAMIASLKTQIACTKAFSRSSGRTLEPDLSIQFYVHTLPDDLISLQKLLFDVQNEMKLTMR